MTGWRRYLLKIMGMGIFSLALAAPVGAVGCTPEPASQWAPAGWICPPLYGDGVASVWGGPGAARNDCVYPWNDCPALRVQSHDTGLVIVVTPTTWCHCWTGVTGPAGETRRIIDLDPRQVAALGLDVKRGLFDVTVTPATFVGTMADTAVAR